MEQGYQGWKNYPTWAAKLHMDNEQATLERAQEIARDCATLTVPELDPEGHLSAEYWAHAESVTSARVSACGERLRSEILEELPGSDIEGQGMLGDLLGWAMQQIDWREIAASYIADVSEPANA